MKRGLLLIDRGSRQREASEELEVICEGIRNKGEYSFVDFCFLPFGGENNLCTNYYLFVRCRKKKTYLDLSYACYSKPE